jgi:hypothetical protein
MTVTRLLAEVSASELTEWMAYFRLEPFGSSIDDYRSGLIASAVFNSQRGRGTESVMPYDWFPWQEAKKREKELVGETPEEISQHLKALLGRVD